MEKENIFRSQLELYLKSTVYATLCLCKNTIYVSKHDHYYIFNQKMLLMQIN